MSAMILIPLSVTHEEHGLATHHPFGVIIVVGAVSQIEGGFLACGVNQRNVMVVIASIADIGGQQFLAVRTPGEVKVAIRVREG